MQTGCIVLVVQAPLRSVLQWQGLLLLLGTHSIEKHLQCLQALQMSMCACQAVTSCAAGQLSQQAKAACAAAEAASGVLTLCEGQCLAACEAGSMLAETQHLVGAHQHKGLSTHVLLEHIAEHLAGRRSWRETRL